MTKQAQTILYQAIDRFVRRGAKAVILGCTEIPLAVKEKTYNDILLVDSLRILARAMIRAYDVQKLKTPEV